MRLLLAALLWVALGAAVAPAQDAEHQAFCKRAETLKALLLEQGKRFPVPVGVLQQELAEDDAWRVSLLRALIKDNREAVRKPALQMLGVLGPEAAAAAPDLVAMLADRSLTNYRRTRQKVRGRIAIRSFGTFPMAYRGGRFVGDLPEAVRRMGVAAVPALIRALDGAPYLRERALEVIEALGPVAAAAVPRLRDLLALEQPKETRVLAAYALAEIGDVARVAVPDLIAVIRDRRPQVKPRQFSWSGDSPEVAAARALTRLDRAFVNATFEGDDPVAREIARRALTTHILYQRHHGSGPSGPDTLRASRWRMRALCVVGVAHDAEDMFAYLEALKSPDENVRAVALASLTTHVAGDRNAALERLTGYVGDASPVVRQGAVAFLGGFGKKPQRRRASRLAGAALGDGDTGVRRAALRVLGTLEFRPLRARLQQLVQDRDDETAAGALGLLCRVNSPQRSAFTPEMLSALIAGDHGPLLKVEAMRGLWRFSSNQRAKASPALPKALDDPRPEVRVQALRLLADPAFRPGLRRLKSLVVGYLEDADPRVRIAAARALVTLGVSALDTEPAVRHLLEDPDPDVRRTAEGHVDMFAMYRRQFEETREQFASEDPKSRLKAVDNSGWLGEQKRPFPLKALEDPDALVRGRAAHSLREMESAASLAAIYRAATTWRARAAILQELGRGTERWHGPPQDRAAKTARELETEVLAALDSDQPELRRGAAQVTSNMATEYGVEGRLFKLSLDPDPRVAGAAFAELRRRDEPKRNLPELIALLDGRTMARGLVLRKLNQLGEKAAPALPALRQLLEKANAESGDRGWLAYTIVNVGRARAAEDLPAITLLLGDSKAHVRNSAVKAIGLIGPPARKRAPTLLELFESDPAKHVRRCALEALGGVTHGSDTLVPMFIRLLDSQYECSAINALGNVGPAAKAAIPALEKRLYSGNRWKREPAQAALEKIRPAAATVDPDRTRCVSRRPEGKTTAWGHCWNPALSADGRFVAFDSNAANLVGPASKKHIFYNVTRQVYLHDREKDQLTCVSVSSGGTPGNKRSHYPVLSRDGRLVVFVSDADNLVPNDFNEKPDVFVHDRDTGKTTRVSVGSSGEEALDRSWSPTFSRDGRRVMFICHADNLVPGDDNGTPDLLVHDRETRQTTRATCDTIPAVKPGQCISFDVRDRDRARLVRLSIPRGDLPPGGTACAASLCDADRQVVFLHEIRIGRKVDPSRTNWRLVHHDLEHGVTRVLLGPLEGAGRRRQPINRTRALSVSDDGRRLVFTGYRSDFVKGDTNKASDVFLLETESGRVTRVSVDAAGHQANDAGHSGVISADGRWAAFIGFADNLTKGDRNDAPDVFVRRLD